jgi:glutamate-1-semialdehyde 2,1-aminomutase
MNLERSRTLIKRAANIFPGGVNSPVRAFKAVGGTPPFMDHGKGAFLFDVDGNRYIDYVLSWGPLILGHADDNVLRALAETAAKGTSFGAPSPLSLELASLVQEFMPVTEMIRFVNSGTEATMSALRLARGFTGRNKVIKFEGNYHGHADDFLVKAGSGVATLSIPGSPGIPAESVTHTLSASYNNLESVEALFRQSGSEIAAIIVEPVAGNMGMIPPESGFLKGLRNLADNYGSLLIFDEVMTGFRVHRGGAHTLYGITPDLITLGKVIGGGLPVGAYGGKKEIMEKIAPSGPVYQAGTLSGNPLAMVAGIETLKAIRDNSLWHRFDELGLKLTEGLRERAEENGIGFQTNHIGSMFGYFFSDTPVTTWSEAEKADTSRFASFHRAMLEGGIYLAPSQFEAGFLSAKHSMKEIEDTLKVANQAFKLCL